MRKKIITISIVAVFVIATIFFFYLHSQKPNRPDFNGRSPSSQPGNFSGQTPRNPGEFSIDEESKTSVLNFFDNSPGIEEVKEYCQNNQMNCLYYCRDINPDHEICNQLPKPNMTRGMPPSGEQEQ
jgi:hypothetical protein